MVEPYLYREESETTADIDTLQQDEQEEKPEKGLFCRYCNHLITYEKKAVAVNDDHYHTFFNPAGIIFEIRCFASAEGCIQHGSPSDEFTWFAGYSWRLSLCAGCLAHMGWFFSSSGSSFFGLIGKKLAG